MKPLHYSILVLLLLTDDHVCSSSADQKPKSISAILQSYADAYTTTSKPLDEYRTTPFFLNIDVKDPGYIYDYTTIKPKSEKRRASLPAYTHVELNGDDSHSEVNNPGFVLDYTTIRPVFEQPHTLQPVYTHGPLKGADSHSEVKNLGYVHDFTTIRPVFEQYRTLQPVYTHGSLNGAGTNTKVKNAGSVYDYTPIRPKLEQRRILLPLHRQVEPKGADSNTVQANHDLYGSNLSAEESKEDEDPKGPPDHVIPYSEHENPKEPQTRPNYTAPGEWAKPPPEKNIPLDFVPTKLYAQVRGTHTVKHLPKEDAIESAETDEEKENAARLKEVVKVSKANTVYTEEGYEDAGYDHAGQIRDADFHEGFARKLKENQERKRVRGSGKRPKLKLQNKKKPRKGKSRDFENFDDDYVDHLEEVIEEARTSQQIVKPEHLKTLKSALNKSVINPKTAAEDGIRQLEEDLRKEAYDAERTLTEPYSPTTTTYKPPTTVPIVHNNIANVTSTKRHEVFTVRPRRPTSTTKAKTNYVTKSKPPSAYYSVAKNSGNYDYKNAPHSNQAVHNDNNLYWQPIINEQNHTPAASYQPVYSETQTVNPVIANPLAVATVNGHGPYLVVVTNSPTTFTSSPIESQDLETTIRYVSNSIENVTKPTLITPIAEHNPYLPTVDRKVTVIGEQYLPQYAYIAENANDRSQAFADDDERGNENKYKYSKHKPSPSHVKMLDYLQNDKSNYRNYYTAMQPPKVSNTLVTYPDYSRGPYGKVPEQWPVTHESARPVESVYDVMSDNDRPRIKPEAQKSALPVTRLLPPAPLSSSEYASFRMRGRRSEPTIPPSVMAIMPIIEAIHKYESQKKQSFPFLFRKKRSALGPSREWEVLQREQRLRDAALAKIVDAGSTKSEKKTSSIRYPSNFHHLLNESPDLALKVVDKEIRQRFRVKPKESSEESSSRESSKEALSEASKENSDNDSEEKIDKESAREKASVEADVPELDFTDLFEEDEPEPTTKKPGIDVEKYPFYKNKKVSSNTPLKYIVNPLEVPRKTLGGMEFYNSRNLECEEIDPNLEKLVPEEEELANKRGPRKSKQRLHGLGDKLDCYKAKYFDEDPLDNPLFFEKEVEAPSAPAELDPRKFASRILQLPAESDEYVIPRSSKSPEAFTSAKRPHKSRNIPKSHTSQPSTNYNYNSPSKNYGRLQEHYQRHQKPSDFLFEESRKRSNKTRSKPKTKKSNLKISPAYQRQVYEDVMGTIMNLENMYRTPVPKRGGASSYSKHYKRDPNKELETSEFDKYKKRRPSFIDGLVPPPQYAYSSGLHHGNKFMYPNTRNNRYYKNEDQTSKPRIYKRSINADFVNEVNNTLNRTNDNTNAKKEKSTFRIILTTPPALEIPEKPKRKRKNVTIIKDESTTQKTIYTINDRIRHSDLSTEDIGKYDKFVEKENKETSVDSRRKEPRYNTPSRRNLLLNNSDTTTSSPIQLEVPKVTSQASVDPSYSGSTLVPVIVKPDENFTTRIPQESKSRYTKKTPQDSDEYEQKEEDTENNENVSETKVLENGKPQKNQYLVHENIEENSNEQKGEAIPNEQKGEENSNEQKGEENPNDQKNEEIVTEYSSGPIDSQEHKELYEFLKGDPPGYAETFGKESTPDYEDAKSKESQRKEDIKENIQSEEDERHSNEDGSKEKYVGQSTSENAEEEEPQENAHPSNDEEETTKTNSQENNEPFVRYSSRPYSPPENYEDDRYSDLGPRINKPYFYHPPFEVPEYEKRSLGKTVDRSDDDWGHSAETEDHETYVFPWEKHQEEEEEKGDESQHYSSLGRYEYPWERRERKERERRMRERLRKKYDSNHYDSDEDDNTEATNTRPVYVSLEKERSRGKKDVNNLEVSSEQRPLTKFSSKYKSSSLKVPFEDDAISIASGNNDEIKKSILSYLENIGASSTPKIKTSKILHKSLLNNTYIVSTSTNVPNTENNKSELIIKNETATLKPTNSSSTVKSLRAGRITTVPTLTTSSTAKYHARVRSRKIKTETNNTNADGQINSTDQTSRVISSTTPSTRVIRRRGRTRDNYSSTPATLTTTSSPSKFNSRRLRIRPSSSNTIPAVVSTTVRTIQERRRRPFRTHSTTETSKNTQKNNQSPTTSSSLPTSTGRTIEHHSRVSKEEIITKTFYPDEDDSDEDERDVNSSKHDNRKTAEKKHVKYLKIKRRSKPINGTEDENGTNNEKVEKVTITMEETPNHVYRTKEIDRDGVKGKFVTITANNNSTKPPEQKDDLTEKDAEMEEIKRRMDAFNSFDSVIRDTEDLTDNSSGIGGAEVSAVPRKHREVHVSTRGYKHLVTSAVSWESEDDYF